MSAKLCIIALLLVLHTSMGRTTTCDEDWECQPYEKCVKKICVVDSKLPGEKCISNLQCEICCTEEYKCKFHGAKEKCKNDFDTTGMMVAVVVLVISIAGALIGGVCWGKKIAATRSHT